MTHITIACSGTELRVPLLTAALTAVAKQGRCKHKKQRRILFLPVAIVSAGTPATAI